MQHASNLLSNSNQFTTDAATKEVVPIIYVGAQILPNGDVKASEWILETPSSISSSRSKDRMTSANTEKNDESPGRTQDRAKRLAKVIDVCGDMGLWIEWIRQEERKRKY